MWFFQWFWKIVARCKYLWIFCSNVQQKKVNDFFFTLILNLNRTNCVHFSPQEQEDLALAQALAASEEEYRRQQKRQTGSQKP